MSNPISTMLLCSTEGTFQERLPWGACSNGNSISQWIMPAVYKNKIKIKSEGISEQNSLRTWIIMLTFCPHWWGSLRGMPQTQCGLKCWGFALALGRQAVTYKWTALLCLCIWGSGLERGIFLQRKHWHMAYAPWMWPYIFTFFIKEDERVLWGHILPWFTHCVILLASSGLLEV